MGFRWLGLFAFLAATSLAQLPRAYRDVDYSGAPVDDAVARLQERLEAGDAELDFDDRHGYLAAVLRALDIPPSSQTLVFTKTSFQVGRISPRTPRAIYFTDDAYVAWLQAGPALEVSSVDPDLGATFYNLPQKKAAAPRFERQTFLCLRCHDSYSLTGGGVPRHLMGSAVPDTNGNPVSHEGWYITDDTTPIGNRWGGWYVTGTHGDQRHLGNLIVASPAEVASLDRDDGANVTDLTELIDVDPYLVKSSDIVALLVLEHQVHVQNVMTRAHYDVRAALAEGTEPDLEKNVEPLVRALLLADEAPLEGKIAGTSTFAADFEARGPFDAEGRTLRKLNLETRLFEYPLSYLVYSRSFDALPEVAKSYVYRRLREELEREEGRSRIRDLQPETRSDILQILEATKPAFASLED